MTNEAVEKKPAKRTEERAAARASAVEEAKATLYAELYHTCGVPAWPRLTDAVDQLVAAASIR